MKNTHNTINYKNTMLFNPNCMINTIDMFKPGRYKNDSQNFSLNSNGTMTYTLQNKGNILSIEVNDCTMFESPYGEMVINTKLYDLYDILNDVKKMNISGCFIGQNDDEVNLNMDYLDLKIPANTLELAVNQNTLDKHCTIDFTDKNDINDFIDVLTKFKKVIPTLTLNNHYQHEITNLDFNFRNNNLEICAIDGFRVHLANFDADFDTDFNFLMNKTLIDILIKILKTNKKDISSVEFNSNKGNQIQIKVNCNNNQIIVKSNSHIESTEFFDYDSIKRNDIGTEITLDYKKVKNVVSLIKKKVDYQEPMIIEVKDNILKMYDQEKAQVIGTFEVDCEDFKTAFNPSYILDVLDEIKTDTVTFDFSKTQVYPLLIKNNNREYLVLPIRIEQ